MIIIDQMNNVHFSQSEQVIVDYITKQGLNIKNMSANAIARETYTSAPLLVRIAKKLGFRGWNDFKDAYIKELEYLLMETDVDASIPFLVNDDYTTIANNIAHLEQDTIEDTRQLIDHDELYKVFSILKKADEIDVYGLSHHLLLAKYFADNMLVLDKKVNVMELASNWKTCAHLADGSHCAIIVSYSGQTDYLIDIAKIYHEKQIPIISITCIGQTLLSSFASACLHMSSREMINTKIGDFASSASLKYLFDTIYAGIFSFHYKENLEKKIILANYSDDCYSEYKYIDETDD